MGDPGSIPELGRSPGEGKSYQSSILGLPLWLSWYKNLPAMWETWVQSLGWEDPVEKGTAAQCSGLENSMDCIVLGVTKSWT